MKRGIMLTGIPAPTVLTACTGQDTPAAGAPADPAPTTTSPAITTTGEPVADQPSDETPPADESDSATYTYRWEAEAGGSSITIPVPTGWTKTEDGDRIEYLAPNGQLLRLNLERGLPGVPVDVFAQQEAEQAGDLVDYYNWGINATPLGKEPNGIDDAATWDYGYTEDGVDRRAIVGGFHPMGDDEWLTIHYSAPADVWDETVDEMFWNHAAEFTSAG